LGKITRKDNKQGTQKKKRGRFLSFSSVCGGRKEGTCGRGALKMVEDVDDDDDDDVQLCV
jgi:hypothetical protein